MSADSSKSSYPGLSALLPGAHRSSAGASLGGLTLFKHSERDESSDKRWRTSTTFKDTWSITEGEGSEGREELAWDYDGKRVEAKASGRVADVTVDGDATDAAALATKIDVGTDIKACSMAESTSLQSGWLINASAMFQAWPGVFSTCAASNSTVHSKMKATSSITTSALGSSGPRRHSVSINLMKRNSCPGDNFFFLNCISVNLSLVKGDPYIRDADPHT